MQWLKTIKAMTFILLLAGMGTCTQAETIKLSMQDAVNKALDQNQTVQVSKLKVLEQKAGTREIESGLYPQLSFNLYQSRQKSYYGSSNVSGGSGSYSLSGEYNSFAAEFQLTQSLFNQSLLKSIAISRQKEQMSLSDYSTVRETMVMSVVSYYLEALRAQAQMTAAESRVRYASVLLEQAGNFESAGTGSKLETARARMQYQNEYQTLSETSIHYETQKLQLAQLIGVNQAVSLELTNQLQYEELAIPAVDSAIRTAIEKRPEMESLRQQMKILELSRQAVKAERIPSVALTAAAGRAGADPSDTENVYSLNAAVSFPLFTGYGITARYHQAQLQSQQQEETYRLKQSEIELEIRKAILSLQGAKEQVQAASSGLESAQLMLDLIIKRYREGISTNIEVVNSQDNLSRAQDNLIRAQYNFNLAKAGLSKAMGSLETMYAR